MTEDFWKQNLVSLLRKLIFWLGGVLVTHGWMDADTAHSWLGDSVLWNLAGGLLIVGSVLWQYAKIKFNGLSLKLGIKAETGTPVGVVKADALEKGTFVTSL